MVHEDGDGASASRVERLATWLSMACALHCLLVPLATAGLPLLGASVVGLDSPGVEGALSGFVLVSALLGAAWGFRRHRDLRLLGVMCAGLCLYGLGHGAGAAWYGHGIAVAGALLLSGASFVSARRGHRHAHHGAECAH